jgi:hypothetical protein
VDRLQTLRVSFGEQIEAVPTLALAARLSASE